MFRIDRNFVKLGSTRSVLVVSDDGTEAGAVGEAPNAAASMSYMVQLQAQEQAMELLEEAKGEAEEQAALIIQAARDEAAFLIIDAQDEIEEERQKAWREGFAKGTEEAKISYEEQLTEKIRDDDEKLKRVLNEIYDERERTYNGLEDEVVGLSLEVVRKIINPAEEALGGVFESLIKNALKQLSSFDGRVVIRVSPAEYERFFASGSAVVELDSGVTVTASILRDAALGGGDCIIDTDGETVNAGLNSQLKYIALSFERLLTEG